MALPSGPRAVDDRGGQAGGILIIVPRLGAVVLVSAGKPVNANEGTGATTITDGVFGVADNWWSASDAATAGSPNWVTIDLGEAISVSLIDVKGVGLAIPEPASYALICGSALFGLALLHHSRRRESAENTRSDPCAHQTV